MVETQNRHLGLGSPCHWKQLAGRGRMMISWGVVEGFWHWMGLGLDQKSSS